MENNSLDREGRKRAMPERARIKRDLLIMLNAGAVSLLLLAAMLPAHAQQQQQQQSQQKPGGTGNPSKLKKSFLKSQVIQKEPDLPYFPHYAGKYLRYRGGLESDGLTKGNCYQLRYETAEKPEDVLNWYESALKQFGYEISSKKPMRLIATLPAQGIGVIIMMQTAMQPGYSPGFKCHYTVRYIKQPTK